MNELSPSAEASDMELATTMRPGRVSNGRVVMPMPNRSIPARPRNTIYNRRLLFLSKKTIGKVECAGRTAANLFLCATAAERGHELKNNFQTKPARREIPPGRFYCVFLRLPPRQVSRRDETAAIPATPGFLFLARKRNPRLQVAFCCRAGMERFAVCASATLKLFLVLFLSRKRISSPARAARFMSPAESRGRCTAPGWRGGAPGTSRTAPARRRGRP